MISRKLCEQNLRRSHLTHCVHTLLLLYRKHEASIIVDIHLIQLLSTLYLLSTVSFTYLISPLDPLTAYSFTQTQSNSN